MAKNIRQSSQIALTFLALLVLLLALAAVDSWLFRDPKLITQSGVTLAADREHTERVHEAYQRWAFEERQRAFSWHARSTKIIFWLSMFVAISGLGLSFWQFTTSAKETERALEENELTIKTELISLAFKSRSIAALVLFLSIAYLVVYALLIYPLREIEGGARQGNITVQVSREPLAAAETRMEPHLSEEVLREASNQPPEK